MPLLPPVERGVYDVQQRTAATRVKVGAQVLPWWPVRGVYLLLEDGPEDGGAPADPLIDVDGVAGVWTAVTGDVDPKMASAKPGQTITYCFLDDDPVAVAHRLKPILQQRNPLLAAPFHPIVPHEWDRYVP
jgi:hypothetical protein